MSESDEMEQVVEHEEVEEVEEGEDLHSRIRTMLQNEVEKVKEYRKKKESDNDKIQKLQDENCHLRVTLETYEKQLKTLDILRNKLTVHEEVASCLKKIKDQEERIKSSRQLIASYKERVQTLLECRNM